MYKRLGWAFRRHQMLPMGIEPFDVSYLHKALSVGGLVGAWLQGEGAGLISYDSSGHGYNGAYTGVTLGQPGVPGMGYLSPFYDGANDFNNIYSAGLANDNLLLNPGFETPGGGGADIWANWVENTSDGALANEAVIVHEGADSAKMTAGISFDTRVAETIVVIPGQRRRVRIWSYGDGVNAGMYYVYDNTNAASIIATVTTGITAAAWGMVAAEYTVPAGCVSVDIGLQCPPVNGGVCYFDATEDRRKDGFQPDQGTIIIPARVANAGVWTDGIRRDVIAIEPDANNAVRISRTVGNNQMTCEYKAATVSNKRNIPTTSLLWNFFGITWDALADSVIVYMNGIIQGAAMAGLGTWPLDLVATGTVIGARTTVPASVWFGNIGPGLLYGDAKPPAEMAYLSTP